MAQFARRAGISEGRVRVLNGTPGALPRPDAKDADGRPLWWASTIDGWCSRTGRKVSHDSLWVHRAQLAEPAAELERGIRYFDRDTTGTRFAAYVIVWDTSEGHVIYLQPLDESAPMSDELARCAAELIGPRWWSTALVVIPTRSGMHLQSSRRHLLAYRLGPDDDDQEESAGLSAGLGAGLAGWVQRQVSRRDGSARKPEASEIIGFDAGLLGRALQRLVPVWLDGTDTVENADRTLSYDRTFVVPDATTPWPQMQARLQIALDDGMPQNFPAGWTALAVEGRELLDLVHEALDGLEQEGDGWYLVCRPSAPAPTLPMERHLTTAAAVTDRGQIEAELGALRDLEGDLDVDDPRGDTYEMAIELLANQLRGPGGRSGPTAGYVAAADDYLAAYQAAADGPVVDAWLQDLEKIDDVAGLLRRRRVRRLVGDNATADDLVAAYRDAAGRYVVVTRSGPQRWVSAEWPIALEAVQTWNDSTVIAADRQGSGGVVLLALTPTEDGRMRTDPVPLLPDPLRRTHAYGYRGTTPTVTALCLARCALGDEVDLEPLSRYGAIQTSPLGAALIETTGPLRLPWPQVQQLAAQSAPTGA